jgi:hypothetical protein
VKRQRRNLFLLGSGAVVLALALGAWILHFKPKRALAAYRAQLIAAGEKLEVAELIPPPVGSHNGADLFLKANAAMNVAWGVLESNPPPAMRMVAPGKAMVGWRQPVLREDKATNAWEDAEAVVAGAETGLVLLEGLQQCDTIDFALDYRQGFTLLLPNLAILKRASQHLNAAMLCALHRGDTETAFVRLRTMLALVRTTGDERLIISQLVRFAMAAITVNATWEFLQSNTVTEEQLATLQREWSDLDFFRPVENALAMERAMGAMTAAQMRESSAEFDKMLSMYSVGGAGAVSTPGDWFEQAQEYGKAAWTRTRARSREFAWRTMWSYPDQLRAFQGQQVLIEAMRQARTNGNCGAALAWQRQRLNDLGLYKRASGEDDRMYGGGDEVDLQSLFTQSILSLDRLPAKAMTIETSRQIVVAAIALKRHRLRHGGYPADLLALAPEFLAGVPRDPADGAPLRYRLKADGSLLLYSVGEDGADGGGDARRESEEKRSFAWQRGRDWVWPQPATDGEIAGYYSELVNKR